MRVTICACVSTPLGWKCQRWNERRGQKRRRGGSGASWSNLERRWRFMQSIMELGLPIEGVNRKVELNVRGRLKKNTNAHTHTHGKHRKPAGVDGTT